MHLPKGSSPYLKGEKKHLGSRSKGLASSGRNPLWLTGGKEAESILKLHSRARL